MQEDSKTVIHPVYILNILEVTKQTCTRLPMKDKYGAK